VCAPWWGDAGDEAPSVSGDHRRIYNEDGMRWFEFAALAGATLSDLDSGVINAVTTLIELATMNEATDANIQVRIEAEGAWRIVDRGQQSVKNLAIRSGTQHLTESSAGSGQAHRSEQLPSFRCGMGIAIG
jgi:hypothetical protein